MACQRWSRTRCMKIPPVVIYLCSSTANAQEQGRFQYRSGGADKVTLDWTQLKLILEGIELKNTHQYKRFQCSARGH